MAASPLWFKHDHDSAQDRRHSVLISRHGAQGYGTFWIIVEQMRGEPQWSLAYDEVFTESIAAIARIGMDSVAAIVSTCLDTGLFAIEDDRIHSPRLTRQMTESRDKAKAAANARYQKPANACTCNAQPCTCMHMHTASKSMHTEVRSQKSEVRSKKESSSELLSVREVFDHWIAAMGKSPTQTKLSDERKRSIRARLADSTVQELKDAIDGCAASEFHMGKNDSGQKHNDITLIFRNRSKVEYFRDMRPTSTVRADIPPDCPLCSQGRKADLDFCDCPRGRFEASR